MSDVIQKFEMFGLVSFFFRYTHDKEMSSSSSDPKVQHVWRLLAKASVEHELAHQQRHENATVARSHVHNAVKHTVRAAKLNS